jgi:hypothetical protein
MEHKEFAYTHTISEIRLFLLFGRPRIFRIEGNIFKKHIVMCRVVRMTKIKGCNSDD